MNSKPTNQVASKNILRNLRFYPIVFLLRIISLLPLPIIYLLGTTLGEIIFWLFGSRRRITEQNLAACFEGYPAAQIRNLARRHFHAMVIGVMTMAVSWWASKKRLNRITKFRNEEVLQKYLDSKKNIILLAPHFTSLEFLGMCLFSKTDMTSMYQRHKTPLIDQLMLNRRSRFGNLLFNYKDTSKTLIKSIRSGTPFYYLPDQDPGRKRGVFAPFFGIQTATFPSLSKLARLGNAIVIPCMARFKNFGTGFEIIFDQPLENYPTEDLVADAAVMNRAIESLIQYAPEQYFWSHKRFKTRPDGEPPFYR